MAQQPKCCSEDPPKSQLGPKGILRKMENSRGLQLATYFFPATLNGVKPKGVLLCCHGHGAYQMFEWLRSQGPGKPPVYEGSWIQRFNKVGFSVCGVDMQGCGRSEGLHGLRNYFEKFEDLVDDVCQFARSVTDTDIAGFQELPTFLLGISLGGCIAVQTIRREPSLFRGAMLLAPMLSLEKVSKAGFNAYLRPLTALINALFPTWAVVAVQPNTHNPSLQQEWDQDELAYHGKTRVRNAAEFLRITEVVTAEMPQMTFPFVVFHGDLDNLCDPDGSLALYERSAAKDKSLEWMPGMWHALTKEEGSEVICEKIIEWASQRL